MCECWWLVQWWLCCRFWHRTVAARLLWSDTSVGSCIKFVSCSAARVDNISCTTDSGILTSHALFTLITSSSLPSQSHSVAIDTPQDWNTLLPLPTNNQQLMSASLQTICYVLHNLSVIMRTITNNNKRTNKLGLRTLLRFKLASPYYVTGMDKYWQW